MKKFLLFSAFVAAAFAMNANDYTDYYKVFYQGQELKDGSSIVCNDYEELLGSYTCVLNIVNQTEADLDITGTILFTGQPSEEQYNTNSGYWGMTSMCYYTYIENPDGNGGWKTTYSGNCFFKTPASTTLYEAILPNTGVESSFVYNVDLQNVDPDAISVYDFLIYIGTPEDVWDDSNCTITITFDKNATGVNAIENAANQTPEYFTLQGMKIDNPSKGIYIVKRGDKTSKEYIR